MDYLVQGKTNSLSVQFVILKLAWTLSCHKTIFRQVVYTTKKKNVFSKCNKIKWQFRKVQSMALHLQWFNVAVAESLIIKWWWSHIGPTVHTGTDLASLPMLNMIRCNCKRSCCHTASCICPIMGCTLFCLCRGGESCRNPVTRATID